MSQTSKRQKISDGSDSRDPPLPDWVDCPNFGQDIAGFIIPSKSPLGEDCKIIDASTEIYSLKQMMNTHRNIGLIIDLTNTTPYYSLHELAGLGHIKIPCDSVPDNDSVNQFVYEVSNFQKHSSKQILVHCTHGFNRTGYMIVHYLKRVQPNMSVSLAIRIFADSRPPGIHKPKYIEALYAFYHEQNQSLFCPPIPGWKKDAIFRLVNKNGDAIPPKQQEILRQSCYELLKLPVGEGELRFPGSRPVSVTRENIKWMKKRLYGATWKTDGTRYLMLITLDGCYLIDSNFNFRRVQMRFPCAKTNCDDILADDKLHHMTLLDGEMVIDTIPETGKQERRFLVCDMMAINGLSISELPFFERWKMVEKEVIEPRNFERRVRCPYYYRFELEPFRVSRKNFWGLYDVPKILKEIISNKLSHLVNGLVFQAWNCGYVAGRHRGLLKWNDARKNSDDNFSEEMLLWEMEKMMRLPMYQIEGEGMIQKDSESNAARN